MGRMPVVSKRVVVMAISAIALLGSGLLAQGGLPERAGGPGRGGGGGADNAGADFSPKPPVLPRSAAEQAKTFLVPAGYRLELVASDPDIMNPAVIDWDGNGRMYISEFRSYMI